MEHGQARVADVVHAVRSVEEVEVGKEGGGVSTPGSGAVKGKEIMFHATSPLALSPR